MTAPANKILLVGSQHGDELLGAQLYAYITANKPELLPNIQYFCANPLAFARNKRFIDSDMNRSYGDTSIGYEADQAEQLASLIKSSDFTYVIDCHTTTTKVGVCFITSRRNQIIDAIINAGSDIGNIIVMRQDIAALSLLSVSPNILALEVNIAISTSETTLQSLLSMVENLIQGSHLPATYRNLYHISGFIKPNDLPQDERNNLQNFKEHKGKYPILYGGDTAHRTYRGFWASYKTKEYI